MALAAPDIHVIITALRMEMRGFSPAAKFLLVRGIGLLKDGVSEDTQRDLAAELGMSIRALTSAQRDLVDAGYASWNRSGSKSRQHIGIATQGQFRHGFSLDTERVREIRVEAAHLQMYVPTYPKEMLKRLILARSDSALQLPEGMTLRYSNRLLLAVLLALSDDFGVVWNCSRARLAHLTGLGVGQVNSQLHKLQRAGFIRHSIPGINGRHLFSRSAGAIVLSLTGKPLFLPDFRGAEYYRLLQSEFPSLNDFRSLFNLRRLSPETARDYLPHEVNDLVDALVRAEQGVPDRKWPEELEIEVTKAIFNVSQWLGFSRQQGLYAHAIYKVCEYASRFLSAPAELSNSRARSRLTLGIAREPEIAVPQQDSRIEQCVLRAIFRFYGYCIAQQVADFVIQKFPGSYLARFALKPDWVVVPGLQGRSDIYVIGLPAA
jgi:hypothetical protein